MSGTANEKITSATTSARPRIARQTMLESISNKTLQLALFQATCKPTRIIDRSFARRDCGTLYHGPRASG